MLLKIAHQGLVVNGDWPSDLTYLVRFRTQSLNMLSFQQTESLVKCPLTLEIGQFAPSIT